MRASVILATYNQPAWLEKVLWGYAVQTVGDFDIVVADDGSGAETAAVVDAVRAEAGLPITHVWHEDRGFRKTEILNRAILATTSDYLIFSDGDCIPRSDFVATHVRLAEPDRYLAGTALRLPIELSHRITIDDIRTGRVAERDWLRAHGFAPGYRKELKLLPNSAVTTVLDAVSSVAASFDGGNASTWRETLHAVNGFDNAMGYGLEDRSLGQRLEHIGVRGKRIRHRAICLHLEHDRPYKTPEMLERNAEIAARVAARREVRSACGLAELAAEPASPPGRAIPRIHVGEPFR